MSRRLAAVLTTTALLATACGTPSSELRVQGNVADDVTVVSVPPLAVPAVDLDAGFAAEPPAGGEPDPTTMTMGDSRTAASLGIGSFAAVAAVSVHEGDRVSEGQQLVQLDDRLLRAALRSAEADAAVAGAQAEVLDAATADAEDARQEIADKRVEVVDALAELRDRRADVKKAIRQLTSTRADLKAQRAEVRKARAGLVAQREAAEELLASLPPAPAPLPPGVPTREELAAAIAQLTEGIAKLDGVLKKLDAGLAELDKGLKQARSGLTKLDEAIAKATDGLHDLDDAAAEVEDAIAELARLRRLAAVAVDTAAIPVELATLRLADAVVTAPTAGTVLSVAAAGDQLSPGATLVLIRPEQATRLTI
ncbi:MAG: biotin/lipoyl-binding protein [Propionicimonas sp.]